MTYYVWYDLNFWGVLMRKWAKRWTGDPLFFSPRWSFDISTMFPFSLALFNLFGSAYEYVDFSKAVIYHWSIYRLSFISYWIFWSLCSSVADGTFNFFFFWGQNINFSFLFSVETKALHCIGQMLKWNYATCAMRREKYPFHSIFWFMLTA